MRFSCLSLPLSLLAASVASAQCSRESSIVSTFRAAAPIAAGQQQNPASAWTYERSGPGNNLRTLLQGVTSPSWLGGAWGSPNEAFLVPLAGPIYSPIPEDNQILFYSRLPSFEGIMLHPNFNADAARAVFSPQAAMTLTSLIVQAELLGTASGTAGVSARVEFASGGFLSLVNPAVILSLAPAQTLSPASGLPLTLNPGDRLVVETTSGPGGNAAEDWVNVNARVNVSGPALLEFQPIVRTNCGGAATIRIRASGADAYQWRKDGVPLSDGVTPSGSTIAGSGSPTLTIDAFAPSDVGIYTCVVTSSCGAPVTSTGATVTLCFADFNCDGFLDFFDYDDFVGGFESGDIRTDYNRDGFLDFFDYDDFVLAFETGC